MRLQLNGFATVAGSKKLPSEVKEEILKASEGKVKSIHASLTDAEGNVVVLKGKAQLSSAGSITCRFALKLEHFELVEIDDPKMAKTNASKEEKAEARVNELAAELLG